MTAALEFSAKEEGMDTQAHWQDVWNTRDADQVSWFERDPST